MTEFAMIYTLLHALETALSMGAQTTATATTTPVMSDEASIVKRVRTGSRQMRRNAR